MTNIAVTAPDGDAVRRAMVLGGAVLALFAHVLWLQVVAEDAYITFRFAQNLAAGHGIVWNVGEPPVEGYTNFLWMVMCAGTLALGLHVALMSQILGMAAALATVGVVYVWARRRIGLSVSETALPLAVLVVSGPFATWAGSGMETTMFGLLLILGAYLFTSYWEEADPHRLLGCAGVFALAGMTRPEGVIVFGLLGLLGLVMRLGSPRHHWRHFMGPLALFVLIFGTYFAWRYAYFGWLLPNTFYAKTGGGGVQVLRGLRHAFWFYAYFVAPFALVLFAALLFGPRRVTYAVARHVRAGLMHPLSAARDAAGWFVPAVIVALYTLYIIAVGGDYMAMFRFFAPIVPLGALVLGAATAGLSRVVPGPGPLVALVASLLLVLLQSTPLEARLLPKVPNNHGTWRGVETERWHAARLAVIGEHFQAARQSPEESLATDAIGVISFVTDLKIFGKHGLVDTYIAHKDFAPGELGSGLPGHERSDLAYIFSKRPTYYMYNRDLTSEPYAASPRLGVAEAVAEAEYRPVSVFLEDPVNGESGYFTYLKRTAEP